MLGRFDLNFYEYEMLTERELCLFFTAFLKTVNKLLRISLISFSQQKNQVTVKL